MKPLTAVSPLGITQLQGDYLYINVHAYPTKPRYICAFETHAHTIDLQYIISGGEYIDHLRVTELTPAGCYDPSRDVQFYEKPESTTTIWLHAGYWAIFFPEDGHRPMISDGVHDRVYKAVVKIDTRLVSMGTYLPAIDNLTEC